MKKILLLMPFFMGYDKILYEELSKKYNVYVFNSDIHDDEFVKLYYSVGFFRRVLRFLNRQLKCQDREKIIQSTLTDVDTDTLLKHNYDIILSINGCYLPDSLYAMLKDKNRTSRFIFYAWDDIRNLWKNTHLRFFDELYSYNIDDCSLYGMKYIPMFVQNTEVDVQDEKKYDISFIATDRSGRYRVAKKLIRKYGKRYSLYIYLYSKKTEHNKKYCFSKPLSNQEYMDVLAHSKCLLEIPTKAQKGPTARCFDALVTKTKVITTNKEIKNYPIWSNNIMVIDMNKIDIDKSFVCSPYIEGSYKALDVGEWLKELGL